jgi:hypothetical protein
LMDDLAEQCDYFRGEPSVHAPAPLPYIRNSRRIWHIQAIQSYSVCM